MRIIRSTLLFAVTITLIVCLDSVTAQAQLFQRLRCQRIACQPCDIPCFRSCQPRHCQSCNPCNSNVISNYSYWEWQFYKGGFRWTYMGKNCIDGCLPIPPYRPGRFFRESVAVECYCPGNPRSVNCPGLHCEYTFDGENYVLDQKLSTCNQAKGCYCPTRLIGFPNIPPVDVIMTSCNE